MASGVGCRTAYARDAGGGSDAGRNAGYATCTNLWTRPVSCDGHCLRNRSQLSPQSRFIASERGRTTKVFIVMDRVIAVYFAGLGDNFAGHIIRRTAATANRDEGLGCVNHA